LIFKTLKVSHFYKLNFLKMRAQVIDFFDRTIFGMQNTEIKEHGFGILSKNEWYMQSSRAAVTLDAKIKNRINFVVSLLNFR